MRRIDALFMAWPFLGSRRLTGMLRAEGITVNRKRVQRLMRIAALGPKPKTTKPAPGHKIFPHLLRDVVIDRLNEVWARTSPTSRSASASSTWSRSSTGFRARCSPGGRPSKASVSCPAWAVSPAAS
ncbi:MAG: IS3 family transposase [Hyphomicrobium sp.]